VELNTGRQLSSENSSNNTTNAMTISIFYHRFISGSVALCILWVVCYLLLAAIDPGRSFYEDTAQAIMGDAKMGTPILHLALPILIAGSLASFGTLPSSKHQQASAFSPPRKSPSFNLPFVHRWRQRLLFVECDRNMDHLAILLMLLPCAVFVLLTIYRHMRGKKNTSLDDSIKTTSNALAMMAEVVGSFLLVPVSRYSSLIQMAGWSPARAVRLHIWAGRIFIIASTVHGAMHMVRWKVLANESLVVMLIPSGQCWTMDKNQFTKFHPTCDDKYIDCSCYDIFRNLAGFLSGMALFVILLTSLHRVRRHCYRLFYTCHIIAAPLALVMVILHWGRSILFIMPSLLYYAASSLIRFVESRKQYSDRGVKVISAEMISSLSEWEPNKNGVGSDYMSLTVEATKHAVQCFLPGHYVQLFDPTISNVSHPFTVNTVPGKAKQLRIIFNASGKFTSQLAKRIHQDAMNSANMPHLYIHGYLGTPNRINEVLNHDVAVMIAGGVGITPYLSLLHHVHDILTKSVPDAFPTKRIVLIWTCRDSHLVDYVQREYLDPLLQLRHDSSVNFKIKFVIYHTCGRKPSLCSTCTDTENGAISGTDSTLSVSTIGNNQQDNRNSEKIAGEALSKGVPFEPSRFATGSCTSLKGTLFVFLVFSVVSWVGLASIWWFYGTFITAETVASRARGLLVILANGLCMAILVNALASSTYFQPMVVNDAEDIENEEEVGFLLYDIERLHSKQPVAGVNKVSFDTSVVSLEEKQGRPSIHQMLAFVDNARHPGLFSCGPIGLMQDIRDHTEERCMMRRQQCVHGASHHIAVYEEAFKM